MYITNFRKHKNEKAIGILLAAVLFMGISVSAITSVTEGTTWTRYGKVTTSDLGNRARTTYQIQSSNISALAAIHVPGLGWKYKSISGSSGSVYYDHVFYGFDITGVHTHGYEEAMIN